MLSVSGQVLGAMEDYYRPQMLADIAGQLAEDYPHVLPRFPEVVRHVIVSHMLARAARWGIDRQNALLAWCNLMIEVAGNFDDDADVAIRLQRAGPQLNTLIFEIGDVVGDDVWERVMANASVLPMLVGPSITSPDIRVRSAHAVQLALGDRPEARQPAQAVQAADATVRTLKIGGLPDAWLVATACRSFYGANFERMPWMRELGESRPAPRETLEALRLRLALDFGRWI